MLYGTVRTIVHPNPSPNADKKTRIRDSSVPTPWRQWPNPFYLTEDPSCKSPSSFDINESTPYHTKVHSCVTSPSSRSPFPSTSPITGDFGPCCTRRRNLIVSTYLRSDERCDSSPWHFWRPEKLSFLMSIRVDIAPNDTRRMNGKWTCL